MSESIKVGSRYKNPFAIVMSRETEKIPTLRFWVDDEIYQMDLKDLAKALKPFLEDAADE